MTGSIGAVVTSPRWVFSPNRPQCAAGTRIEPAPSDAVDAGTSPAATADAAPPLEPPGVAPRSHGLRVMPPWAVSVNGHSVSSGVRATPMMIAPAARSRRTSSQSSLSSGPWAREPHTRGVPATAMSSLTAIGTPSSGRSSPPRARPPAWSASSSARSANTTRNALRSPSRRSMRSSAVSTSSRGDTSPLRTSSAWRATPAKASSRRSVVAGVGIRRTG